MARSLPPVIASQDGGIVVVLHVSALLVEVRPCQFGGASYHDTVGAVLTFAATAHAAEQVVIVATLVQHRTLESTSGNLGLLLEVLHCQCIVGQFCYVNVVETSPSQVFLVKLLDVDWVYAIVYSDFLTAEHLAHVGELLGRGTRGNTDARARAVSPESRGIIQHIPTVDVVGIGSPEAVMVGGTVSLDAIIPCGTGYYSADVCPVYKV